MTIKDARLPNYLEQQRASADAELQPLLDHLLEADSKGESLEEEIFNLRSGFLEYVVDNDSMGLLDSELARTILNIGIVDGPLLSEELPDDGAEAPVKTNVIITREFERGGRVGKEFFLWGMQLIAERRSTNADNVGPENYATLAHYYHLQHDKGYSDDENLNQHFEEAVEAWQEGLLESLDFDELNVVELGNLSKIVPVFKDKLKTEFYHALFRGFVKNIDDMTHITNMHFYGLLGNMPAAEIHNGFIMLFEIAISRQPVLQRTYYQREIIRAVDAIPSTELPDCLVKKALEVTESVDVAHSLETLEYSFRLLNSIRDKLPKDRLETRTDLREKLQKYVKIYSDKMATLKFTGELSNEEYNEQLARLRKLIELVTN